MSKQILNKQIAELALFGGPAALTRKPPDWPYFDESDRQASSNYVLPLIMVQNMESRSQTVPSRSKLL